MSESNTGTTRSGDSSDSSLKSQQRQEAAEQHAQTGGMTQEDIEKLSLAEIIERIGQPDEVYRMGRRQNSVLYIWKTGDSDFTVVSAIEAIDGHSPTIVLAKFVHRPAYVVRNMKTGMAKVVAEQER